MMKLLRLLTGLALLVNAPYGFGQEFYDPAPVLEPVSTPEVPDAEAYIQSISGGDPINPLQRRGLLDLFMEERGMDPDSSAGRNLLAAYFPEEAARRTQTVSALDARYRRFGSLFLSVADQYETTPGRIVELLHRYGLEEILAGTRDKNAAGSILKNLLFKNEVETLVDRYPTTPQGLALRELGGHLTVKSGKSIEEISRSGAFLYADFSGLSIIRISAGRDPDVRTCDVVFYVELRDKKWDIHVYRQNERTRAPRMDAGFVHDLKDWFVRGGVPGLDFPE